MKLLLVHPGSDVSTGDVYAGLAPALARQGVDLIEYPLSQRISRVGNWLEYNYRRARKQQPDIARPTFHDTLYLAAERALPIALLEAVDWVVVVSGMYFLKQWLVLLRRAGLRVALLLTESPYDDEQQLQVAPFANLLWTNERRSVPYLQMANRHTFYLPHAYDPARHHPTTETEVPDDDVPAHDVVFVGSAFDERVELLSAVNWEGVDLGLYGTWRQLPPRHRLRQYARAEYVPNTMAAALYRRAKIGLNLYRQSKGLRRGAPRIAPGAADSLNPRALELAACGCFHLSDARAEVAEVFGGLVPTFETPQELGALIRGYLADDHGRHHMAAQLPACVAGHTFDDMARHVVTDLERVGTPAQEAA